MDPLCFTFKRKWIILWPTFTLQGCKDIHGIISFSISFIIHFISIIIELLKKRSKK